jgi:hypothetical protein
MLLRRSDAKADVELFELAVQMRAFQTGAFGDPAHVALFLAKQLLE